MRREVDPASLDPIHRAQRSMGRYVVSESTFGNRFDKAHVLDVYRRHNEDVKRLVPREKLLVFDGAQGWGPLCAFLGVSVPAAPYPKTNTTEEFRSRASTRVARNDN
jgi:hypothetical protein